MSICAQGYTESHLNSALSFRKEKRKQKEKVASDVKNEAEGTKKVGMKLKSS